MFQKLVKLSGSPTHHYFVVDPLLQTCIVRDADGKILVFTDRGKALAEGHRRHGGDTLIAAVGMGDEKWALFQKEWAGKFRVVE